MKAEYDCGPVHVSVQVMRREPLPTFQIIHRRYGPDAARRLYEQWWATVPDVGAQFHDLWEAGWAMQDALGLKRSAPSPA